MKYVRFNKNDYTKPLERCDSISAPPIPENKNEEWLPVKLGIQPSFNETTEYLLGTYSKSGNECLISYTVKAMQ